MAEVKQAHWLETLPCGCQDVHYSDGSVDYEHDHVQCDGKRAEGWDADDADV